MNGSVTLAKSLVDMLNNATIPAGTGMLYHSLFERSFMHDTRLLTSTPMYTEVVISPPAIYVDRVRQALKKEIGVAAQNSYVKASGAYTGEIRQVIDREMAGKNRHTRSVMEISQCKGILIDTFSIALNNSRTWVLIGSSLVTLNVVNTLRNLTT